MSVNKRKREKVCMKTNDGERLVRKPEKHIRHLVLNARDLPRHLAFDLALETGSSVDNATSLALLRHSLAFTSIRRTGQRTSVSRFAVPQSIVFMQMSMIWHETSFLHLLFLVWLSSIHAVVFENGIFESGDFFRVEQRSNHGWNEGTLIIECNGPH